jgi:hypothetical protein
MASMHRSAADATAASLVVGTLENGGAFVVEAAGAAVDWEAGLVDRPLFLFAFIKGSSPTAGKWIAQL